MDSSKNVRWTSLFKKFSRLRVKSINCDENKQKNMNERHKVKKKSRRNCKY